MVEEIKAQGRKGLALVADVSKGFEVDEAIKKAMDKFGKIDILVHAGGIRGAMTTKIVDLTEEEWRNSLDINLTNSS